MKRMKRTLLSALLALNIAAGLATPALAVSGWETHPGSDRQAAMQELQTFLQKVSGELVVNMQVAYTVTGINAIPNTQIDKSHYAAIAEEVKTLALGADASPEAGGAAVGYRLLITTQKETVAIAPTGGKAGGNLTFSGSLGKGVYSAAPQEVSSLAAAIRRLPGVSQTLAAAAMESRHAAAARRYASQLAEAQKLLGAKSVAPDAAKAAPFRVAPEDVDTVQIYDGDEFYVRVTDGGDRTRLLNLVNLFTPVSYLEKEKTSITGYDDLRLELRMKDGKKHEYRMSADSDNLAADGYKYNDPKITKIFTAVLAEAFYRYPPRVAWLGFMHRRRIASAVVYSGTGSRTYSDSASLDRISQRLKDIAVLDCTVCRDNSLPDAVRAKTPTQTVTLAFDTGAIYNIAVYDGTYLTMEWVGDDRVFFYTLA